MTDESKEELDRGDNLPPEGPELEEGGKNPTEPEGEEGKQPPEGEETPKDSLSDEEEETEEERAEREAQEAEEAKKKRVRIPKSRFDEAQAKARAREQALLEEIDRLKGSKKESETQKEIAEKRTRIEELQDKYEDLILDGKKDEARKVRREVDALREELVEYQTGTKAEEARRAAVEELTYNAQLAALEAQYPALNPDHGDFDEESTAEVATLLNAFVQAGMARAQALAKAVKYVMGPPPTEKPKDDAQKVAEKRATEARKKAAEASKQQPADISKVGLDSDKGGTKDGSDIDVMRLTQEKFAKLDEETLSKLRGDTV